MLATFKRHLDGYMNREGIQGYGPNKGRSSHSVPPYVAWCQILFETLETAEFIVLKVPCVGGIEAEAVMLGQPISMVLPEVVGYKLMGSPQSLVTSTDIVLTITKHLRQVGVVGKFVEFFGPGVVQLSIADRATIANMCPEYGATAAFFPVDKISMKYLEQTGRDENKLNYIERYLKAVGMFRDFSDSSEDPEFTQ
eukprot:g41639.t1